MGGLSRKAHLINQYTSAKNKPALILDAGALLFEKPVIIPSQLEAKKIKAEGIVQALQKMKYEAIGIASQDLAAGVQFIKYLETKFNIPFLSINLASAESNEPLFTPYQILNTGEISIAVLGLTGIEPASLPASSSRDYSVIAWQEALQKTLNEVAPKSDMIILLSSFPEQKNREIATTYSGIHLILQSGHGTSNRPPALYNNTLITQIGSRGKFQGKMDVSWTAAKKWTNDHTTQLKTFQDRLDRVNWQIDRMEKRYGNTKPAGNAQYDKLLQAREGYTQEIERIRSEQQQVTEQLSSYKNTFAGLKMTLPEDNNVLNIVNRTKQVMHELNKARMQKQRQEATRSTLSPAMIGWKSCRNCHPAQTEFWQQTKHAGAWQTLKDVNQQYNEDCLLCHVTLPFYDREKVIRDNLISGLTEEFHNVTCESCHGPGRKHSENPDQNKTHSPDEKTCLNCHTPDHDTDFDFDRKVQIIRCPG